LVEYEAYLVEMELDSSRQSIDKNRTNTAAELETINADPIYTTVSCEAAEQDLLEVSVLMALVRSLTGAQLDIEDGSIVHHPTDYLRSWEGVTLLTLYGLPASEFGYVRTITIRHLGRPVPFMTTVLDADLPTGLITSAVGKSPTVVQKLKYIVRGRRNSEEFESDEIDLSGAIPPSVDVTIRRKASAKLNRKRMR